MAVKSEKTLSMLMVIVCIRAQMAPEVPLLIPGDAQIEMGLAQMAPEVSLLIPGDAQMPEESEKLITECFSSATNIQGCVNAVTKKRQLSALTSACCRAITSLNSCAPIWLRVYPNIPTLVLRGLDITCYFLGKLK